MPDTSEELPRVTLEAWLVTDVGMVREHNEDSAHCEPTRGFFIVADGMGGHAAGEVASAMAVQTVRETLEAAQPEIQAFTKHPTESGRRLVVQLLQHAVLSAHRAVFERGRAEPDKAGMGTTLDVVLVAGPEAFVAHVGDSRTYLLRDGRSSQVTTDHTVAEVLVIEGKLTLEEAQVSPLRTILVNAIGVSDDVGVEMAHVTLKQNDRLLVCSDGLHDYFPSEEEVAEKLSGATPGEALAEMVELAKTRGGHDNITGITVLITSVADPVPDEDEADADSTKPIEPNQFADEPTETTYITPPGLPPKLAGNMMTGPGIAPAASRATAPLRIINAEATGDTLPPADAKQSPRGDDNGVDTQPQRAIRTTAGEPVDDEAPTAPAVDRDGSGKAKKPKVAVKSTAAHATGDTEEIEGDDAVPEAAGSDAASADTGRVRLPEHK